MDKRHRYFGILERALLFHLLIPTKTLLDSSSAVSPSPVVVRLTVSDCAAAAAACATQKKPDTKVFFSIIAFDSKCSCVVVGAVRPIIGRFRRALARSGELPRGGEILGENAADAAAEARSIFFP